MKSIGELLNDLITEHGSAAVLRDHLALIRDKAKLLVEENEDLKKRLAELEDLCRRLTGELEAKARSEEFVEHRGVLFKRNSRGGYHQAVYCPICRNPLSSLEGFLPYACTDRCGFVASFSADKLGQMMADLPP